MNLQFWEMLVPRIRSTARKEWIKNHGDAKEQMAKNGGVAKKLYQITSTVRGTYTEAVTVRRRLWCLNNMLQSVKLLLLQVMGMLTLLAQTPTSPFHTQGLVSPRIVVVLSMKIIPGKLNHSFNWV